MQTYDSVVQHSLFHVVLDMPQLCAWELMKGDVWLVRHPMGTVCYQPSASLALSSVLVLDRSSSVVAMQVQVRVSRAGAAAPPAAVSAGAAAAQQAAADAAQAAEGAAQAAQAAAAAAHAALAAAQAGGEPAPTTAAAVGQAAAAARQAAAVARQAAAEAVAAAAATPASTADSGTVVESFEHKPYLIGVHCDSPARQKMACWLGVAGYLACGWCLFMAQRLAAASGKQHVYPKGYKKAVVQPHLQPTAEGVAVRLKVGDARLQLSDEQQRQRARVVLKAGRREAIARAANAARRAVQQPVVPFAGPSKQEAARQQGCNGLSAIPEIEYVSYSNIWVAPVIHMLLYGVVAEFLRQVLGTQSSKRKQAADRAAVEGDDAAAAAAAVGGMSSAGKKAAAQRAADVQVTSDFGRAYKDVTKHLGSFKMEDYLHFVETFSLYIFRGDVSMT